jgi:hypothetical protein
LTRPLAGVQNPRMKVACLVVAAALGAVTLASAQTSPAPVPSASPPPAPGAPSAALLDVHDPQVEALKWSVLGVIGIAIAGAWMKIRLREEDNKKLALERDSENLLKTFKSQLEALDVRVKKIEGRWP